MGAAVCDAVGLREAMGAPLSLDVVVDSLPRTRRVGLVSDAALRALAKQMQRTSVLARTEPGLPVRQGTARRSATEDCFSTSGARGCLL
eukprot:9475604-Pyramimonas_sp.AAC.1